MEQIKKIINYVRIAPHGIVPTAIATGLFMDSVLNLGLYENLPPVLKALDNITIGAMFGLTTPYIYGGIRKYRKFKEFIEERGIDKRHVEKNLVFYCNRQAYKAAAYSCELGKEFDEINRNYEGEKCFQCIPEI